MMITNDGTIDTREYSTYSPIHSLLWKLDNDCCGNPKGFLNNLPRDVKDSREFFFYIIHTRVKLSKIIDMFELAGMKCSDKFYAFFLLHSYDKHPTDVHRIYVKEIIERTNIHVFLEFVNNDADPRVEIYGKQFLFNLFRKHLDMPLFSINKKGRYFDLCLAVLNKFVTSESNWKLIVGDNEIRAYNARPRHISVKTFEFWMTVALSKGRIVPDPHDEFWNAHPPEDVVKLIRKNELTKKGNSHVSEILRMCCYKKLRQHRDKKISLEEIDDFLVDVYGIRKSVVMSIATDRTTKAGNLIKNFRKL